MNEAEEKNEAAPVHTDEAVPTETNTNTPPPAPQSKPAGAPPPATTEVLDGKETEASADLKRKLDERDRDLTERERKLAEKEARLQRQRETVRAPEKKAWLSGNALVD